MKKWHSIIALSLVFIFYFTFTVNAQISSIVNLAGNARDIAIGSDGSVWIVGNQSTQNGFALEKWNGWKFEVINSEVGGLRVGVDPNGFPYSVGNAGIIKFTANSWVQLQGTSVDISVGADGTVWEIGNIGKPGVDAPVFVLSGGQWTYTNMDAIRIAVDPQGNAWVVKSNGEIMRWTNNTWQLMPGRAIDIGIGANGSVWVIGTDTNAAGDGNLYQLNGTNWERFEGTGTNIAVDQNGFPWVVNSSGVVFTLGAGYEVGVGIEKSVSSGPLVIVNFFNNTASTLDIQWVDFEGNQKLYATLESGKSFVQLTTSGHLWRFTQNNVVIGSYRTSDRAVQVVLINPGSSTLVLPSTVDSVSIDKKTSFFHQFQLHPLFVPARGFIFRVQPGFLPHADLKSVVRNVPRVACHQTRTVVWSDA